MRPPLQRSTTLQTTGGASKVGGASSITPHGRTGMGENGREWARTGENRRAPHEKNTAHFLHHCGERFSFVFLFAPFLFTFALPSVSSRRCYYPLLFTLTNIVTVLSCFYGRLADVLEQGTDPRWRRPVAEDNVADASDTWRAGSSNPR